MFICSRDNFLNCFIDLGWNFYCAMILPSSPGSDGMGQSQDLFKGVRMTCGFPQQPSSEAYNYYLTRPEVSSLSPFLLRHPGQSQFYG